MTKKTTTKKTYIDKQQISMWIAKPRRSQSTIPNKGFTSKSVNDPETKLQFRCSADCLCLFTLGRPKNLHQDGP